MRDLEELLAPAAVVAGLSAGSKKKLIQHLGTIAAEAYGVDGDLVSERIAAREKLGSTGFGGGIAIPHGPMDGLKRVKGVFVRLAKPIDFSAVDGLPVDLVFMLLSPPESGASHLRALASVSRRLRDRTFAAKLRGAGSDDALYVLLAGVEARDAA